MKHATASSLKSIDDLLVEVRGVEGIREKTTGVFYRKSQAFLHFHEEGGILYADVRLEGPDFDRVRVSTVVEKRRLVAAIRNHLARSVAARSTRSRSNKTKDR